MIEIIQKIKQTMTLPMAALLLVAASLSFSVFADSKAMAAPIHMQMVAMPHPDDEHQA